VWSNLYSRIPGLSALQATVTSTEHVGDRLGAVMGVIGHAGGCRKQMCLPQILLVL